MDKTADFPESDSSGKLKVVDKDFRRALSVDTCDTRVSPEEAVGMYDRLFGEKSAPADTANGLGKQATKAVTRLDKAAKKLAFAEFPTTEYETLLADSLKIKPVLPMSRYRKALDGYTEQSKIKPVYDWGFLSPTAPRLHIKPVDNEAEGTDRMARRTIVGALGGLSFIPQDFYDHTGLERMYFGDIREEAVLGLADSDKSRILFETNMLKNHQVKELDQQSGTIYGVPVHELTHMLMHNKICEAAGRHEAGDNALRSLNRGFLYYGEARKQPLPPNFLDLDTTNPGTVASVRLYGKKDPSEDTATLAEVMFYGPNVTKLYSHDGDEFEGVQDLVPVKEKAALLLTRLSKVDKPLAEYYVRLLQVGRLQAAVNRKAGSLEASLKQLKQDNPGIKDVDWYDYNRQEYEYLNDRIATNSKVQRKLDEALRVGAATR